MESHDIEAVIFSEILRTRMQLNNPPLIRYRRPFFRGYANVFIGAEAVIWATNNLLASDNSTSFRNVKANEDNGADDNTSNHTYMSDYHAISVYQKLMDAGLVLSVNTTDGFKNDKSLFRFLSDAEETNELRKCVAVGFRLFKSAQCSASNLFQRVCAFGELVSAECLKSSDIVAWLVENGLSATREAALLIAKEMVRCQVLKPVDTDITEFIDGRNFYLFAIDYNRPPLTAHQFLSKSIADPAAKSAARSSDASSRNRRIHLRQTSENLKDLSHFSTQAPDTIRPSLRKKGLSTSSSDSGFNDNGSSSPPSYHSLLKDDGSITKAALLHPKAPFIKKDFCIHPDAVGYGFVIRGSGPCYVKIVDPDSPAGKAGIKASQYITAINGESVLELPHTSIEDFILNGPKKLKIAIMQPIDADHEFQAYSPSPNNKLISTILTPPINKQRSTPVLPSAQPWIKRRNSNGQKVRQLVTQ